MNTEEKVESLVLQLFEIKVLKFGNFKLKSGVNSPVYLDLRLIVSYPKIMDFLACLLVEIIRTSETGHFQHICGVPYTALPIATLISAKSGTPMLIRRKETKNHGTRKLIEGEFSKGDQCIIIEDVVSSGSSIMETVEDLRKEGLEVNSAFVVLDRGQGGIKNLQDRGIKVYTLTSLIKVLNILLQFKKITEDTVREVEQYISNNKICPDGSLQMAKVKNVCENRLKMTFSARAKLAENKLASQIFQIMESKKTLLCLAADVTKSSELIRLALLVGSHICILKIHFDIIEDFSKETFRVLIKVSKNLNFLIMEDRKFSDIGNTVCLQYNQIKHWADLITAHSLAGERTLTALKSCIEGNSMKGCFLVAQLSSEGQIINEEYTQETVKMAESHPDFVVGLVCQSPDVFKSPQLIQLTPGVRVDEKSDNMGQNYNSPEHVILHKGADIAVVGRGIILSSDPEKAAIFYKEALWKAYQSRIS